MENYSALAEILTGTGLGLAVFGVLRQANTRHATAIGLIILIFVVVALRTEEPYSKLLSETLELLLSHKLGVISFVFGNALGAAAYFRRNLISNR